MIEKKNKSTSFLAMYHALHDEVPLVDGQQPLDWSSSFNLAREDFAMANEKPLHQGAAGQNYTVTQAQGYLNYIGETRVYFLLPNLGWQLYFDISDQALKMQVLTAFAHPAQFKVYVFHTGNTVNSVQVVTA